MSKTPGNDLEAQKAKEAAALAEARSISKVDQEIATIRTKEQVEKAVADGAKPAVAEAAAKTVKVMVRAMPNNGILTLNNNQLRIPKVGDLLNVPYAFAAAFPAYLALVGE